LYASPQTSQTHCRPLLGVVFWAFLDGVFSLVHAVEPVKAAVSDSATIKVNFPNAPILAIVPFYTEITGKKIILDSSLQDEPMSSRG
jgi:type II secretory pathway component GspD/PulD (secretin)